jgi:hypothetical protein
MKIQFKTDVIVDVIVSFDEDSDTATTEAVNFYQGDETEIEICDAKFPPHAREIQFGDGSVAFVTPNFWAVVEIL